MMNTATLFANVRLGVVQRVLRPQPTTTRSFAKEVVARLGSPLSEDERKGVNDIPRAWSQVDPAIVPHLRSCEPLPETLRRPTNAKDTRFHVYFLGTGSGNSDTRLSSCTLARLGQECILVDAGEGAKRYIRHTSLKIKKIQIILITHLHSDHVLGLPAILLAANLDNRSEKDAVVKVYGPPGLYNFIIANLALTNSKLNRIKVEVYELMGGSIRTHWKQRGMLRPFPQFRHDNVIQKTIQCDNNNNNGVWTLKDFDEITRETNTQLWSNVRIQAAEVQHVPNCQSFGFVVEEQAPVDRIDVKLARSLGVKEPNKYRELKNGFPVGTDDGTGEVRPEQVLIGSPFKSRKLALLGDSCGIPSTMAGLCKDADVVVHEATLDERDQPKSVGRGHSTASMAGQFADSVRADLLVLNHHNDSVLDNDQMRAREAKRVIHGGTRVLSANDFMEISVPREGFQFVDREIAVNSSQSYQYGNNQSLDETITKFGVFAPKTGTLLPQQDEKALDTDKAHDFKSKTSFTFSKKL